MLRLIATYFLQLQLSIFELSPLRNFCSFVSLSLKFFFIAAVIKETEVSHRHSYRVFCATERCIAPRKPFNLRKQTINSDFHAPRHQIQNITQ